MLDARHSGHYKNKSVQLLLQKTICQQQYLQSYLRFVCQWEAQKRHRHHHHCGQHRNFIAMNSLLGSDDSGISGYFLEAQTPKHTFISFTYKQLTH